MRKYSKIISDKKYSWLIVYNKKGEEIVKSKIDTEYTNEIQKYNWHLHNRDKMIESHDVGRLHLFLCKLMEINFVCHLDGDIYNNTSENLKLDATTLYPNSKWTFLKFRGIIYDDYLISTSGEIRSIHKHSISHGTKNHANFLEYVMKRNEEVIRIPIAKAMLESFKGIQTSLKDKVFSIEKEDGTVELDSIYVIKKKLLNSLVRKNYDFQLYPDNDTVFVNIKGGKIIIDLDFFENIFVFYNWRVRNGSHKKYITAHTENGPKDLHQMVIGYYCDEIDYFGLVIDHINGNTFDNRICNLRAITSTSNAMNTSRGGVVFEKKNNTYVAQKMLNGKLIQERFRVKNYPSKELCFEAATNYYKEEILPKIEVEISSIEDKRKNIEFERGLRQKTNNGEWNDVCEILSRYGYHAMYIPQKELLHSTV